MTARRSNATVVDPRVPAAFPPELGRLVRALLRHGNLHWDGRLASWTTGLAPEIRPQSAPDPGSTPGGVRRDPVADWPFVMADAVSAVPGAPSLLAGHTDHPDLGLARAVRGALILIAAHPEMPLLVRSTLGGAAPRRPGLASACAVALPQVLALHADAAVGCVAALAESLERWPNGTPLTTAATATEKILPVVAAPLAARLIRAVAMARVDVQWMAAAAAGRTDAWADPVLQGIVLDWSRRYEVAAVMALPCLTTHPSLAVEVCRTWLPSRARGCGTAVLEAMAAQGVRGILLQDLENLLLDDDPEVRALAARLAPFVADPPAA